MASVVDADSVVIDSGYRFGEVIFKTQTSKGNFDGFGPLEEVGAIQLLACELWEDIGLHALQSNKTITRAN